MAIITETTRLANPRPQPRKSARQAVIDARYAVAEANRKRGATQGQINRLLKAEARLASAEVNRKRGATGRNPTTSRRRRTARRANPTPLVYTLGFINPRPASRSNPRGPVSRNKKGNTSMARSSRRRRGSSTRNKSGRFVRTTAVRRRRRNPVSAAPVRRRRRTVSYRRRRNPAMTTTRRRTVRVMRRRRNPSVYGSRVGSAGNIKMILGGLVGIAAVKLAAKIIPMQFRVGGGIGDTLITGGLALGVGMLATRFLGGPIGDAAMFGGLMYAGSILLNTLVPGFRIMDVPLALSGLGDFAPARFSVPQNPITAGMAQLAPAPAAGVSGYFRGQNRLP
jgi:hypothetical protein